MAKLFANSEDPDQTPHSVVSDLGLLCLPITLLWVSWLQWVKPLSTKQIFAADNILNFLFYFYYFSEKTSLDISCEPQFKWNVKLSIPDFIEKLKKKKKCCLLQLWLWLLSAICLVEKLIKVLPLWSWRPLWMLFILQLHPCRQAA